MTSDAVPRRARLQPADPRATALLVTDDRIAWLGTDDDAPTADVDGATSTARWSRPAFVDAHVHATDTGSRWPGST